ncbi:glycosyltransferase family 2 protein [Pararoseomonas indoligenes]|uniref:Glycosyltransferase family 2 protein n=1 Tax=Roseomonas indoligenes TaxID=2820811 RepID=A0A940MX51_9PROT|nr:glycosyltransferase family A protein [Pararoseomonas indoligenes]MBP0495019.1 glycosyltransferase family 2 protein [Pararoseomonas indoligenes]
MRISVLLPCWNAAAYVGEALRSVLEQNPAPADVIAVDDGSTDATAAVLESFGSRVTVLRQPNRGVAAALNAAAARATGEALAFLDADDLWLPGKLALQGAALAGDATLDGAFGHIRNFVSPELSDAESRALSAVTALDPQPGLAKGTLLLRRTAFDRIGNFEEERRGADFIAWYARAMTLGFCWTMLPDLVCARRLHRGNMGRYDRARQHGDYLLVMKAYLDARRSRRESGA